MRTIVECSPQFGQTEQQLEAVQAVHAAVAARQVGGPQPRLVARRADVAEIDVVVGHDRRSRAMKKPSVPSRCGSVWRKPGTLGWSQTGRSDGSSSTREVASDARGRRRSAARSRPARSCRSSTRARRRGARRAGAGVEDRRLHAPRARPGCRAPCASARRAARRACRGPSTAGRRARGRRRRRSCGSAASAVRTSTHARAHALRGARERLGAPGWRSTATTRPSSPIRAARWVVLPPGAAQRSSTRSPGRGASARATAMAARDCGMNRPSSHSGEPKASNGASSTRPSGSRSAGVRGHRAARAGRS